MWRNIICYQISLKMRKIKSNIFAILGLLIVSLTPSCSDDLEFDKKTMENEVRVKANIGNDDWNQVARSLKDVDGVGILSFSEGDNIVVDSWYLPNGISELSTIPDFMMDQVMTYNGSNWDYTPIKYWPNNSGDRLAFFAYHFPPGLKSYTISENDPITGYPIVKFTASNYAHDLLAIPITIAEKPNLGGVQLNFKHIMAYVKVKARVATRDGSGNNHKVYINKTYMHNTPRTATFKGFDENENPIWENVSIFEFTKATTGDYVKTVNGSYVKVATGKGNYVYDENTGTYTYYDVATHVLLANGKYQICTRGDYVLDSDGNYVQVQHKAGNYVLENGAYIEVDGPGTYWSNCHSISSAATVELPETGEYVELVDFNHFMFPVKMLNDADQEWMSMTFVISDKRHDSESDIGGEYVGGSYGYEISPDIEFKAGYVTTIYLTVGLHGIDNVEYDTRPFADWSGDKTSVNVEF